MASGNDKGGRQRQGGPLNDDGRGSHVSLPMQDEDSGTDPKQVNLSVRAAQQCIVPLPSEQGGNEHVHTDQAAENTPLQPLRLSFTDILTKRFLSLAFIIISLSLDWFLYSIWSLGSPTPVWVTKISQSIDFGSINGVDVTCLRDSNAAAAIYGVFCGFGTVYAIFQILNVIGETILEYRGDVCQFSCQGDEEPEQPSRLTVSNGEITETRFEASRNTRHHQRDPPNNDNGNISIFDRIKSMFTEGFQLIHGWTETIIAIVCFDIPQIILAIVFSVRCMSNFGEIIKLLIWYIFKCFKHSFRYGTCRQFYKTCSQDCREMECCTYTCNVFFLCKMLYLRLCPKNHKFFEIEDYEIFSGFHFRTGKRGGRWFGPVKQDPRCARHTFENVTVLSALFYALLVFLQVWSGLGLFHTKFVLNIDNTHT